MLRDRVLKELCEADGNYISGETLSKMFNVSRTAVWKSIISLRNEGYVIESSTKKGYCLISLPDRLTPIKIGKWLDTSLVGKNLVVYDSVISTNLTAKGLAEEGAVEGTVVIAEEQTGGRGRMERSFYSPPGLGVWMSVILKPDINPQDALLATVMAGVAVSDAIFEICGKKPEIKWTNDIIADGKKLCGILTEMSIEAETNRMKYIIIGMGINVNHTPKDFPDNIKDIATSLGIFGNSFYDRAYVASHILKKLEIEYLNGALTGNRSSLVQRYRENLGMLGRKITLVKGDVVRVAEALDINENAELIVRYEDGSNETINSGEVSSIVLPAK